MSRRSILFFGSAALALAAAVIAWMSNHRLQALHETASQANHERVGIETSLRKAKERVAHAEKIQVELQTVSAAKKSTPPIAPGKPLAAAPSPAPKPAMDNPAMRRTAVNQFKARMTLRFGALYRELGLNSEQIARFEGIMIAQDDNQRDFNATLAAQSLKPSDPAAAQLRRKINDQTQTALADALGEAGYEQYQEFNRTENRRTLVRGLVSGFALSSTPITPQQAQQLTDTLNELDYKGRSGNGSGQREALLARAEGFLTLAQLAELEGQTIQSPMPAAMSALGDMIAAAKK